MSAKYETSLKPGFAQIFSCCPKNLSYPKSGGGGAAAPPNFGQLSFFGQQEKIWAKPGFEDVSMFFIINIILKR